ncbi:hypothetical protein [Rheinheimera gaetbuli]
MSKLAQLGYALGGLGQAYVKSYNGKSYIILKGHAGLRRVLVGLILTPALNSLDKQFGISDKVVKGLEELSDRTQIYAQQLRRNLQDKATQAATKVTKPVLDYIVDSAKRIVIDMTKHRLERFLNPRFF